MQQREFANQKALVAYAEQNGLYVWAFPMRQWLVSPASTERQRLLARFSSVSVRAPSPHAM
jgi:hypothetical protein